MYNQKFETFTVYTYSRANKRVEYKIPEDPKMAVFYDNIILSLNVRYK